MIWIHLNNQVFWMNDFVYINILSLKIYSDQCWVKITFNVYFCKNNVSWKIKFLVLTKLCRNVTMFWKVWIEKCFLYCSWDEHFFYQKYILNLRLIIERFIWSNCWLPNFLMLGHLQRHMLKNSHGSVRRFLMNNI